MSAVVGVKVSVLELRPGMYVGRLDRSWRETRFLLEGVLLKSQQEIDELQQRCEYVYIDTERSNIDVRPLLFSLATRSIPGLPVKKIRPQTKVMTARMAEQDQELLRKELKRARQTYSDTRQYIDQALQDARFGRSLDTARARQLVAEMAQSITRTPNAMLWLSNMKKRDEYTSIHCLNVCVLALTFGRAMGLEAKELETLGLGALLHDVGKMKVPLEILNKPGKLTREEFQIIKLHTLDGYNILSAQGDISAEILDIVVSHHERIDGSGYPCGTQGDFIDTLSQITSIVDVYDAITSDRCYHDGMTPHDAMKLIYHWAGDSFDIELIDAFIQCLGIYPVGSVIGLKSGEFGVVVTATEHANLRPIILLVTDSQGQRLDIPKLLNLAHPKWTKESNRLEIERIVKSTEHGIDLSAIVANPALI